MEHMEDDEKDLIYAEYPVGTEFLRQNEVGTIISINELTSYPINIAWRKLFTPKSDEVKWIYSWNEISSHIKEGTWKIYSIPKNPEPGYEIY